MPVDTNNYSFYIDDYTDDDLVGRITIQRKFVTPVTWATTTSTSVPYLSGHYESSKHFNCKRCGAPNQVGACEYCGCAAEN